MGFLYQQWVGGPAANNAKEGLGVREGQPDSEEMRLSRNNWKIRFPKGGGIEAKLLFHTLFVSLFCPPPFCFWIREPSRTAPLYLRA